VQPRLVLFDIDATILLSGGAGSRAMTRVGRELFGENFHWNGIDPYGALDNWLIREAVRVNGHEMSDEIFSTFRDQYLVAIEEELRVHRDRLTIMPGVVDILEKLHKHDEIILALLTGNYTRSAELKIRAADIPWEWFQLTACGDDADTRPELTRIAMQRYRKKYGEAVEPERVVVVGDTPKDVHCATENDCRCVAVATGKYSVTELEEAGAHLVVENFADPRPVLEFFGID
jgi:phosphoglycolate phosphatase-like HAD superfamily hydrolase